MSIRLGQLVERLGGQLLGNPDLELSGIAPIELATASQITFLSNSRLRSQVAGTRASAIILSAADSEAIGLEYQGARVITNNPYAYFAKTAQMFVVLQTPARQPGIHPTAVVDSEAKVAASAWVGPHVTIEAGAVVAERCIIDSGCFIGRGAVLGEDTHFFANVTFHAYCEIGQRGIIHSGAVIGADGFGFANENGVWIKIPQTGRVMIGDDVEIGANTTIDRGTLTDTVLENGVKLDNQIQVAHNCHIGAHTAMAGCVGIAGSAKIGKHCTVGGAAMILGHLTIADRVHISTGTLVNSSILEPGSYTGFYPIAKHEQWEKSAALVRNLTSMREKIRALEKAFKTFGKKNNDDTSERN